MKQWFQCMIHRVRSSREDAAPLDVQHLTRLDFEAWDRAFEMSPEGRKHRDAIERVRRELPNTGEKVVDSLSNRGFRQLLEGLHWSMCERQDSPWWQR